MKELLELIISHALGGEAKFEVIEEENPEGVTLHIKAESDAIGKIIGKAGRNIKAIRDVLNIIARREERRVFIKVD